MRGNHVSPVPPRFPQFHPSFPVAGRAPRTTRGAERASPGERQASRSFTASPRAAENSSESQEGRALRRGGPALRSTAQRFATAPARCHGEAQGWGERERGQASGATLSPASWTGVLNSGFQRTNTGWSKDESYK